MQNRRFLALLATAALLTASHSGAQSRAVDAGGQEILRFGLYRSEAAATLFRRFSAAVRHVEQELQSRLGRAIHIEMQISPSYDEAIDAVLRGEVDFARFGPASFVTVHDRDAGIGLLAAELKNGQRSFSGVIFARADAGIARLEDVRGRRFAFGDRNSTIGRYLAQHHLVGAGIRAGDLAETEYLGRHDKVAKAVLVGDFDAGAVKMSTFEKFASDGELVVLERFDLPTKPWLSRSGLDPETFRAIRAALLEMDDPAVLGPLGASGFTLAAVADYAPVAAAMKTSAAFGTLP